MTYIYIFVYVFLYELFFPLCVSYDMALEICDKDISSVTILIKYINNCMTFIAVM